MGRIDNRLAWLGRLSARYAPQVASLFGLTAVNPTSITMSSFSDGRAGQGAYQGGISFTEAELRGSRADLRGALIHELAHVEGAGRGRPGYGGPGGKVNGRWGEETMADYARYTLNPNENPSWSPTAGVLAMAQKRGTEAGDMAGPGSNKTGNVNSNKNTVLNYYGKQVPSGATPAAADPNSYGAYATQVMGLQQQLASAMALARAGIGSARGQYMVDRTAAHNLRISETAGAEAQALQAGTVGGSYDLTQRAGAITDAAAAQQAALAQRNQTLAAIRGQQVSAVGAFYGGLGQAQMGLSNAQAMANIDRYLKGLADSSVYRRAGTGVVRNLMYNYAYGAPQGATPGMAGGYGHQVAAGAI